MNEDEDDLSYLNDFQEILQSEVYVDLERLRILARHGVPDQLRGVCFFGSSCTVYWALMSIITGSLEILARRTTSRSL